MGKHDYFKRKVISSRMGEHWGTYILTLTCGHTQERRDQLASAFCRQCPKPKKEN